MLHNGETEVPAKITYSIPAFFERPCNSCGRERKSRQVSSHRLAVSAFAQAFNSSTRAADGFELPRSHLEARFIFDDELEEEVAGQEEAARQASHREARRAAASTLLHSRRPRAC